MLIASSCCSDLKGLELYSQGTKGEAGVESTFAKWTLTVHPNLSCVMAFSEPGTVHRGFSMFLHVRGCRDPVIPQRHPHGAQDSKCVGAVIPSKGNAWPPEISRIQTPTNQRWVQPNVSHLFVNSESKTNSENTYWAPVVCKIVCWFSRDRQSNMFEEEFIFWGADGQ